MRITKRNALGGIAALMGGLALLTYFTSAERKPKIAVESFDTDEKSVVTEEVLARDVPLYITEVGVIRAVRQVTVKAEVSGKVVRLDADVGDRVSRGEVLVELEDRIPRLQYEEARAALMVAEASFEKARKDLERGEQLFASNDISVDELESLKLAARSAEGRMLQARAAMEMAEKRYEDTKIASPIDGVVTSMYVETGEMVAVGMPVAVVVEAESVEVTLGLADTEVSRVKEGQSCSITVDAYPGRSFPGRVKSVSLKADEESGTFPVVVTAENTESLELKPGMVARVRIETGTRKNAVVVPRDALVKRRGKYAAFVVEDGRAVERRVRVGPRADDGIVIESGVYPGDRIVVIGVEILSDGDRVREGR